MICLQTPSFGWSFQDGRLKQRVARPSPIFQISDSPLIQRPADNVKKYTRKHVPKNPFLFFDPVLFFRSVLKMQHLLYANNCG